MSIKLRLASAALTLVLASLSAQGSAVAQSYCNGQWVAKPSVGTFRCYYLPTVSGGRVTGLDRKFDWGPGGAVIGQRNCRYLPTVAGGRVVGSHQVCG